MQELISILQDCRQRKNLNYAKQLHAYMRQQNLESNPVIGNYLVPMLVECGSLPDAQYVFDRLPYHNEYSWTSLISGYIHAGKPHHAFYLHNYMQEKDHVPPNRVTYLALLDACTRLKNADQGHVLHTEITLRGLDCGVFNGSARIGNTLVDMYGKCGLLAEAQWAFGVLPVQDAVSWASLVAGYAEHGFGSKAEECFRRMHLEGISPDSVTFVCCLKACGAGGSLKAGHKIHLEATKRGLEIKLKVGSILVDMYCKCGSIAEAYRVFDRLPVRNAVSWTALIAGYAELGLAEEVLGFLEQMQFEEVYADAVTFVLCLKACATVGTLEIGRAIHVEIRKLGLETDLSVGNTLIDMYGKCGSVAEGREVFDKMMVRDVVSWSAMIKAYGENHEGHMAVKCFKDMLDEGIKPDSRTFTCVLAACSHASLVHEGQEYFEMLRKQDIEPTLDHYACMVDLLARSGCIYEAERFIAGLQCAPSNLTYMPLLAACKIYGKLELGHRCFQQLVEVNHEDASAYLLIADIYTSVGRWSDASKVEEIRNYACTQKMPGSASMEVNQKLHSFVVGVKPSEDISEMLEIAILRLKDIGHVPNLDASA